MLFDNLSVWLMTLVSLLSLLIITPVVAFYLLCDWDRVVVTVDGWIPRQHRDTVHALLRDIDAAIAGFVRGQAVLPGQTFKLATVSSLLSGALGYVDLARPGRTSLDTRKHPRDLLVADTSGHL